MPNRWILAAALSLLYALGAVAQTESSPRPDPQAPASEPATAPPQEAQPPAPTSPAPTPTYPTPADDAKLTPPERAWKLLNEGLAESSATKRSTAVRVLSLLEGEQRALDLSIHALDDEKPEVRSAACSALGELHDRSTIPALRKVLTDKEPSVIIAAGNALLKFQDPAAYRIFYAVLTGDMKGGKGIVASQLDQLKDKKQLALLGFQEGIGFIPFAGIGYDAYRAIKKDDGSPVRAAAARALTHDPDSISEDALVQTAIADKSELVRNAALTAIAHRGSPRLIPRIALAMFDDKDSVRYTAAAAILHLDDLAKRPKPDRSAKRTKAKPPKPVAPRH